VPGGSLSIRVYTRNTGRGRQAIDYGIEASEVERHVVSPGQAPSHMIGELKILELRQKAKNASGDKFSLKELFERAGEAVELPHDGRVAGAGLVERPMKLGPIPPSAGRRFLEHLFAAGLLEGEFGKCFLGLGFRDAGVVEEHERCFFLFAITDIWQWNYAKRKPAVSFILQRVW
jgi:hypothetical protein